MVNDIQLRFVCRTNSGSDNRLYITDNSTYSGETVQIKIEIIIDGTVYYVDNTYSHPQGGEKAYNVPVYEGKIKNGTYSVTAYFKEGTNETTVTKTAVLDYEVPLITPKLVVDGMGSIIYGSDATTTPYQHVKTYKHTKPNTSEEFFSDDYSITPIQSGTHRLDIYHDITITNINYELRDYISGYTEVVAYKLNETDIYSQLVSYKRAYAQEANPSVRRNMLKVINQLDRYEDDYFMSKRIKDSLTAYDALKNIYLTLNEAPVENVADIPVWDPTDGGCLTEVVHDISLTGDGTAQSPLSTNVLYAEVTALGNIASLYINQDIKGNPFSLKNGETIEIVMAIDGWVNGGLDRINVRVNDISDTVYKYAGNTLSYFFTWGYVYKMGLFRQRLTLLNNNLYSYVFNNAKLDTGKWVYTHQTYAAQIEDLELTEINSLFLFTSTGGANIPAGTKVYIKKYKI